MMYSSETQDSKPLLELIFENTHTMIAYLDTSFRFIRVNQAYAKVDGRPCDEFVGKGHFELYPNDENEKIFNHVLTTGEPYFASAKSFDYEFNPERGTTHWDWSLKPVKNGSSEIIGLILVLVDVSERVNAQLLLQKAQQIANIGTWDWDIVNDSLIWTDEAFFIFEQASKSFSGKFDNYLSRVHPDDKEIVEDELNASLENQEHLYNIEHRILTDNKNTKYVLMQARVFHNKNNKPVRMIGIVHDITERKITELELNKYRLKLEDLVDERTKKLIETQEEMVRKQRLATLGQLTATVGHELRNPLGAMSPSIYILKKLSDPENPRIAKSIDTIERNINRCNLIIDELLTFARVADLELQETHLDSWLESLLPELFENTPIQLTTQLNLTGIKLPIDQHRMRRAFINIIDNAKSALLESQNSKNYATNSQITIASAVHGNYAIINISDNGCGIPDDIKNKIFEPLFSTKSFGVGLGMPIIKQIIEQHGGEILIESKLSEGTMVSLKLPLHHEQL